MTARNFTAELRGAENRGMTVSRSEMVNASEAGRTKGKASQAQGADRRRAYSTGGPATREPGGKAFIASFWSPNLASSSSSSSPTSDGAYRVGSGGMRPNHASKSLKGEDPAGTKSQRRPDSAGREAFRSLGQGGTGGIGGLQYFGSEVTFY